MSSREDKYRDQYSPYQTTLEIEDCKLEIRIQLKRNELKLSD